uniref:Transmembrane protein n=1 Tax=Hanusia phi TaxID=3032 RepID=A0A6T7NUC5_9CRYP|mmetsp:Transcript_1896/g.4191  ORF Transcript_1896/g.4191 Transcript_1896/m.4191 type:complete len:284 (+) Transcript_1896:335-1186(+)
MKGTMRRIAIFLLGCLALAAGVVILIFSLKEREFVKNFVHESCQTVSVTGRNCMEQITGVFTEAMITAQRCETKVYTQLGCTCQGDQCDCSGGAYGQVDTYWWKVLTLVGAITISLMGLYMLFASYLAVSDNAGQVSIRIFSALSGFFFLIFAAVGAAMIYFSVFIQKDSTFNTQKPCTPISPVTTAEIQAQNCVLQVECVTIKDLQNRLKNILYELGIPFLVAAFVLLLGTFSCCCCSAKDKNHAVIGEQKGEIMMHANTTAEFDKEKRSDVIISMPSAPEL